MNELTAKPGPGMQGAADKDSARRKRKLLKSSWPLVIAAILFAFATFGLVNLYSTAHWDIAWTASMMKGEALTFSLETVPAIPEEKTRQEADRMVSRMLGHSERLEEAGYWIMTVGGFYHLTALLCLLCSFAAFLARPRWAAVLTIPFSLYAMVHLLLVM